MGKAGRRGYAGVGPINPASFLAATKLSHADDGRLI